MNINTTPSNQISHILPVIFIANLIYQITIHIIAMDQQKLIIIIHKPIVLELETQQIIQVFQDSMTFANYQQVDQLMLPMYYCQVMLILQLIIQEDCIMLKKEKLVDFAMSMILLLVSQNYYVFTKEYYMLILMCIMEMGLKKHFY